MKLNSKQKGNRGERELVKVLETRFGKGKFKRTPQSGAHVGGLNQEMNENLPWEAKITLVSDIITPSNFIFVLEHKYYEGANFWDLFNEKSELKDWLRQVELDASFVNKQPMLVCKYNRKQRIVYVKKYSKICWDFAKFSFFLDGKTWYCYWLEDLLKLDNVFWMEEK